METDRDQVLPMKKKQKRQHGYSKKSTGTLYLSSLWIRKCDRFLWLGVERRFKCCYYLPQHTIDPKELVLSCYVLDNNICLLTLPFPLSLVRFCFTETLHDLVISGKWKKGAKSIDGGDEIASAELSDGSKILIKSPIGGKVLEVNDRLLDDSLVSSLLSETNLLGDGFIAILSSEAPKNLAHYPEGKVEEFQAQNDKVCFAWLKGQCNRGGECRFEHCK